jgi:beta-aspartyl-peptidase (threonine type)
MLRIAPLLLALLLAAPALAEAPLPRPAWALAVHGGAGGIPQGLPEAEVQKIRDTLGQALAVGGKVLESGGSSVDAVQAAVALMEASGVLNAGRGAVLDHQGRPELDAAIMDGRDRAAGAVAAVRHVASPIALARLVMDSGQQVLLVGAGAEAYAREHGMRVEPDRYFITPRRYREWRKALAAEQRGREQGSLPWLPVGTVGAVALDRQGNLAAATSTGGLTNKRVGRVGDSPIIGAGTYALNGACAVSATGHGEFFIRYTAASEVCARVRYRGEALGAAASSVIEEMRQAGGEGGLIALDAQGNIAMPYSSATMLRGQLRAGAAAEVVVQAHP